MECRLKLPDKLAREWPESKTGMSPDSNSNSESKSESESDSESSQSHRRSQRSDNSNTSNIYNWRSGWASLYGLSQLVQVQVYVQVQVQVQAQVKAGGVGALEKRVSWLSWPVWPSTPVRVNIYSKRNSANNCRAAKTYGDCVAVRPGDAHWKKKCLQII